jgi:hypothetical protein
VNSALESSHVLRDSRNSTGRVEKGHFRARLAARISQLRSRDVRKLDFFNRPDPLMTRAAAVKKSSLYWDRPGVPRRQLFFRNDARLRLVGVLALLRASSIQGFMVSMQALCDMTTRAARSHYRHRHGSK